MFDWNGFDILWVNSYILLYYITGGPRYSRGLGSVKMPRIAKPANTKGKFWSHFVWNCWFFYIAKLLGHEKIHIKVDKIQWNTLK